MPVQKLTLIPASTIPRAFLSSLRANLQIPLEDLSASSHYENFHSLSDNYDLQLSPFSNDVIFSSGFTDDLEDPPSPTDTATTSSTQSFAAPTTWIFHASTEEDRSAALKLISDSIREQRMMAVRSILFHPAVLALICLLLTMITHYPFHPPRNGRSVACFVGMAILTVAFLATYRATRGYLALASIVSDPSWLREGLYQKRNHHNHSHHNSLPMEDEVLITKDHDEVVGVLVLRTARTNALSSGAPSANGMRALRHRHSNSSTSGRLTGVIRAWTVKPTHRYRGLGSSLLESAVSICRVRRLDGPIFADEQFYSAHAPGMKTLYWPFNKTFEKTDELAKDCLKTVIEGKDRKK